MGVAERDISAIMRKVRSIDTAPEMRFRKALWGKGIRYRTASSSLPGKPDIVISSKRLCVFIDGDFWHGGQWKRRSLSSLEDQFRETTNINYWLKKIRRNIDRDCIATSRLLLDGWTVIRFWESEIRNNLEGCVEMTVNVIKYGPEINHFSLLSQKTFADFFSGIGLMRIGLENQGWSVLFSNDIDSEKYKMYKGHFPDSDSHYLVKDIHHLSIKEIPTVSLATASFPCNDLSLAGSRHGLFEGKQSSAFWGFIDILEEMNLRRPPLVLIENVTGFLTSHKGEDFKKALLALNRLGYTVDAFIIDAARFVPQSRQRLFVIGVLEEKNELHDVKTPIFYESDVRPKALAYFILSHPEINWQIRNLPSQPHNQNRLEKIIEDLKDDSPEWWSKERAEYLFNQMSPRHRLIAEQMMAGSEWSYGTVFRRIRNKKSMGELRTDGLAGCLRTPRGGSGRQILFKAGKGKYFARLLTPRECARLMGADEYNISVPLNQALFGFGDAVCVPVIEWIAKYYLNPLVNELIRNLPLNMEILKDYYEKNG
jgi:DNA (cytosine-5)-methyltransferase 1